MAEPYLIKLVRDEIPTRLGHPGTLHYEPIRDPDERRAALYRKLVEESIEFLQDPSITELADVFEVVRCIAEYVPEFVSFEAVINEANDKRATRGGFEDRMGMYAVHPNDGQGRLRSP